MPPSSASSSLKIYFNQETKISEIWEWFYTVEISTFFFFFCLYHIKIFCAREEKSKPQQHADEDEEPLHRWRDVPAAVVDLCSLSKKKR